MPRDAPVMRARRPVSSNCPENGFPVTRRAEADGAAAPLVSRDSGDRNDLDGLRFFGLT